MKPDNINKVEDALKRAYQCTPPVELSPYFSARVMHEIRETGGMVMFQQRLWRFATLSSVCSLLLIAYVIVSDMSVDNTIAGILAVDPTGVLISQPFGV